MTNMEMVDLITDLESLRIDVASECFGEPVWKEEMYNRANEMLDDCIMVVKRSFSRTTRGIH